jgi:hypothetical protein
MCDLDINESLSELRQGRRNAWMLVWHWNARSVLDFDSCDYIICIVQCTWRGMDWIDLKASSGFWSVCVQCQDNSRREKKYNEVKSN